MILLIDNYDSFTYNLYQSIASLHLDIKIIRHDKISVDEAYALKPQGIILSPGPGRPEDAGICVDLIKQAKSDIPILGVCLGHQAITIAFGGQVIAAPEIVHGKPDSIFHYRKGLYQDLPLPFQAGRYHSLIVDRASLPPCFIIEAESSEGLVMGIRHESYPIYGVQFHPESILSPEGPRLLARFIDFCTKD